MCIFYVRASHTFCTTRTVCVAIKSDDNDKVIPTIRISRFAHAFHASLKKQPQSRMTRSVCLSVCVGRSGHRFAYNPHIIIIISPIPTLLYPYGGIRCDTGHTHTHPVTRCMIVAVINPG